MSIRQTYKLHTFKWTTYKLMGMKLIRGKGTSPSKGTIHKNLKKRNTNNRKKENLNYVSLK